MAINKNHEFEELDGIKCAIVERNVPEARALFLRDLLTVNGYTVVITLSPPPKQAVKQPAEELNNVPIVTPTYTVGVTNLLFNAINAVFGRLLKTNEGKVVTQAYWLQKEEVSNDEVPYFQKQII